MATKVKVHKNDQVLVTTGKYRGITGKVLKVFPNDNSAIVERVRMIKRHTRANPQRQIQGGIVEREAPISLSNLKVICPECGQPARMGRARLGDGSGARECKNCGKVIG